ncbi:hypothetical protein WMF30_27710 [Sorangium sp. So ce134]
MARGTFHHRATSFSVPGAGTLSHTVVSVLDRARRDLIALRMYDIDQDERSWTVAAGLPIYIGLFGRDPLAAGTQAAALTADILAGTALVLPRWQGRVVDDWRDEQPDRMLHQARDGALSALNDNPLGRTYASATSTMFYAVAASELWHWTGDRERVGRLIEPALRAMRWIDEEGDLDGDGFYEYEPRSSASIQNQGWKDSDDAIVHADGSQVRPPIGTCEMQGFVFLSKLRLSELLFWFGRKGDARRLFDEALDLQRRFNDAFWMPDARTFAMGLGPDKRQIRSISCWSIRRCPSGCPRSPSRTCMWARPSWRCGSSGPSRARRGSRCSSVEATCTSCGSRAPGRSRRARPSGSRTCCRA